MIEAYISKTIFQSVTRNPQLFSISSSDRELRKIISVNVNTYNFSVLYQNSKLRKAEDCE